jgi:hypothetical protein
MLSVPAPRTFVVGEIETAAYLNTSVRDTTSYLIGPPIATVYQTLAQSLAANTPTPIAFDSTAVDTYGGHSNTANNSRYTAVVPGYYLIGGGAPMANSIGGTERKIQMYYNGAIVGYASSSVPPTSATGTAVTPALSPTLVFLNVGDFVSIYATVDTTGVSITPGGSATNQAYMTVIWSHA